MKGTSFQNGIEFKISIEGESWVQGSLISGTIEAIARNPGTIVPELQVLIADASEKKVKLKSKGAFEVIERAAFKGSPASWKFTLPIDARLTDKSGNLYVLYGPVKGIAEGPETTELHHLGQLKLNILPHPHLQDFLEVIKVNFRFVPKSTNAGKDNTVDAKFDSPAGKDWASLEYLLVSLKMNANDKISSKFQFCRSDIDPTKGGLSAISTKREIIKEFELAQFIHEFNQRLNKEAIAVVIEAVIAEYRSAGWLAS